MRIDLVCTKILHFLVLLTLVSLAGCEANATMDNFELATPEGTCQTSPASWQGIAPAKSTKADVIGTLGQPTEKGYSSEWKAAFFLYSPIVNIAGTKYGNLIVFRHDDVVDWVDVWISNLDGSFHTVDEAGQQYGFTLDRVYVAGAADMFGPAQVYVWSQCGVAVTAVDASYMRLSESETLPLAKPVEADNNQFSFLHPVPPKNSVQPVPDVNHLIVREFLFRPTSFGSFQTLYASRVSYFHDKRFFRLNR